MDKIEVKPGQVWQDNDPRVTYTRTLKVVRIEGEYAHCEIGRGPRKTKVKLSRFRPTSTGYRFVSGPQ